MLCLVQNFFIVFLIISFNGTKMAKSFEPSSSSSTKTRRELSAIETTFILPSPLPNWPPGGDFASGTIDLGGLQVSQVSRFNKIWAANEGGPGNSGATFYDPDSNPEGFSILGSYAQPNNMPLFGQILVGKDVSNDPFNPTLKPPIDYILVWTSEFLKIKKDGEGYIWYPNAPDGYRAVGYVVTSSSEKPSLNKIRCVRSDFTDDLENDTWVWGPSKGINVNGLNVYASRPKNRGVRAMGASIGGFVVQNGNGVNKLLIYCLKNVKGSLVNMMPNLSQIEGLIQAYSPIIYFHPNEQYLPSSVDWFFRNGALLYHKGDESNPSPIDQNGSNLPQGGSNDNTYWIDLPKDGASKERVKKGNLQDSRAYFHVKPMYGGIFTDIAIWLFYPFNGASRAKFEFINNISLGKIGEHVGDWEHVTIRISNFNGELHRIFFSQHSWGSWVSASVLEYATGNKPVVYSSLHGHSAYPKPGCVLIGPEGFDIGLRDDTAKSDKVMDTGVQPLVVAAEYLGAMVVEPPWLNYQRKWGPKVDYDIDKEINKVERFMIGKLKSGFEKFVKSVPSEVLGEDGPTGPKVKNSWIGDEIV